MTAAPTAETHHLPSLDGLRGVAAMAVAVGHFSTATGFANIDHIGGIGVMIFFALSGFLMGHLNFGRMINTAGVLSFYRRRAARVLPLYIVVVATSFSLYLYTGTNWPMYEITDRNLLDHILMIKGTDVLWTIPVEVQFYLLFPIAWFAFSIFGTTVVVILASLALAQSLVQVPGAPIILLYYQLFFCGIIASTAFRHYRNYCSNFMWLLSILLMVLLIPDTRTYLGLEHLEIEIWESPATLLIIGFFIWASATSPTACLLLGNSIARLFGKISFSIYILHMPVLHILLSAPFVHDSMNYVFLYILLISVLAAASFYLIERPLQNIVLGRSYSISMPRSDALMGAVAVVIAIPVALTLPIDAGPGTWSSTIAGWAGASLEASSCTLNTGVPWEDLETLNASVNGQYIVATGDDPQITLPMIREMNCVSIYFSLSRYEDVDVFFADQNEAFSSIKRITRKLSPRETEMHILVPAQSINRIRIDPGHSSDSTLRVSGIELGYRR